LRKASTSPLLRLVFNSAIANSFRHISKVNLFYLISFVRTNITKTNLMNLGYSVFSGIKAQNFGIFPGIYGRA
jgi:hypothetical protein